MSNQVLLYLVILLGAVFLVIILAYLRLRKKMQSAQYKQLQQLKRGTQKTAFSSDIIYQKLYLKYRKIPLIKRYLLKLRRRLEIINIDDEYLTRKQAAKILTKGLVVVIPLTILIIALAHSNLLLLGILIIFEIFILDSMIDGMVDKIDNNLLKQQIGFFGEIIHHYHEFNMVEESI